MTELNFKGKEFVYNHHLAVPVRPLEVDPDKGIGEPRLDGNLIIQGDNLHALKALLPYYAGKVDCIFIDPPYNTGNEGWAYNDNVRAPMIQEWLNSNPIGIEDGLRHDKWCAMMWPRLRLLHELLAETGSLWVTIDDNEVQRARALLDEVFGPDNFIASCIWQKRFSPSNDEKYISTTHDYLLVYAKDPDQWERGLIPRTDEQLALYSNPDEDPRGRWASDNYVSNKSRTERPNSWFPIYRPSDGKEIWPSPTAVWRYSQTQHQKNVDDDRVWWGEAGTNDVPRFKRFLTEVQEGVVPQTLWWHHEVGHNQGAKQFLKKIFSDRDDIFQTPKPIELLMRVLQIASGPNGLILDSFAGSGTTAHAVLEANKRDGGNRRFILVEMEDYADRLTAERVRRVMTGYDFTGTQSTELLREKITWTKFKKAEKLTERVEKIENLHGHEYDSVKKSVKDGELIVTGEKKVKDRAEGLGGEFTYCTLGPAIELDKILTGETLPAWTALGGVLFHMATNRVFDPGLANPDRGYLGRAEAPDGPVHVWLIYRPDLDWLKTPEAALTLSGARTMAGTAPGERHVVFAPARHVSRKMLDEQALKVDFAPLPFALYRVERD
ncbi:site-specific DNA-methyltransferase [Nioella ostreopsis]|uniref:site-specific DNA-methyltransferase n=1 Tax=Nioella ostreopsis TaxID=2448479 RepID=UPI000FDC3FA4|nr:site-specific DNA-methyltransferase [Nioella ostreopsis]